MNLIWIRHGETRANREGRYCGWSDPPLNRRGRDQVKRAVEGLPTSSIRRVWTSDLLRCRQTAELLLSRLSGVDVIETSLLRELSFGDWEGWTFEEIRSKDPDRLSRWIADPRSVSPPGGETLTQMEFRLQRWLDSTLKRSVPGESVVVVSHGGPIRWFLSRHLRGDLGTFWDHSLPHGSMVVAEWSQGGWRERVTVKEEAHDE